MNQEELIKSESTSAVAKAIAYGDSFVLPQPTKIGHVFIGWFDGSTEFEDGEYIYTNDINLDAKWDLVYYPIKYIYYGGILTDMPTSYTYNDEVVIPNVEREGYTFIGWIDADTNEVVTEITNKDYNLIAKWEKKVYKLEYNLDGGLCDELQFEFIHDGKVILPTPVKEGYTFAGWSTSASGGTVFDQNDTTLTPAEICPAVGNVEQSGSLISYMMNEYENNNVRDRECACNRVL